MLMTGNLGTGYKAVPVDAPKDKLGPMAGGCFIYTCDSRMPGKAPIALHDRYETQEEYDFLSH
jgi:hypothetical protein